MSDEKEQGPFGPLPPALAVPIVGPFRGPRVTLKRFDGHSVHQLAKAISENIEHLAPMMRWIAEEPKTIEERRAMIVEWNREADQGRGVVLGCFVGERLIGSTGLHRRRPNPASLEIGYWIDHRYEGHGFATECSLLLSEVALSHDEIDQVSIYCDDANERSALVAQRAGFTFVGTNSSPEGQRSPGESGLERHYVLLGDQLRVDWRSSFSSG
jgi:RimJ/RimL family protein N-acetyltransferase